jgi:hypothetical protein
LLPLRDLLRHRLETEQRTGLLQDRRRLPRRGVRPTEFGFVVDRHPGGLGREVANGDTQNEGDEWKEAAHDSNVFARETKASRLEAVIHNPFLSILLIPSKAPVPLTSHAPHET